MTTFTTSVSLAGQPSPWQHVNYVQGLVLGVDDFTQEHAYTVGRSEWLARETIGYGTLCGLSLALQTAAAHMLEVRPGTLLTPQGRLARVCATQCANLATWVASKPVQDFLSANAPGGNPPRLSAYVVLSYAVCLTDPVPVPGEPCRSEDDALAPSRVRDDFRLDLSLNAPEQHEEDALRDFCTWLRGVKVVETGVSTSLEDFRSAIRDALDAGWTDANPAPGTDYLTGSPANTLQVMVAEWPGYLREAIRLWSTEFRPLWRGTGASACGTPPDEERVLLGRVDLTLAAAGTTWQLDTGTAPVIDESARPCVLHLRMVQEWLLGGGLTNIQASTLEGDITGPLNKTVISLLFGKAFAVPAPDDLTEGNVLTLVGEHWTAAKPPTSTGPKGDKGDQGDKGEPGISGTAGVAQIVAAGEFGPDGKPIDPNRMIPRGFAHNLAAYHFPQGGPQSAYYLLIPKDEKLFDTQRCVVTGTVMLHPKADALTCLDVIPYSDQTRDVLKAMAIDQQGVPAEPFGKYLESGGKTGVVIRVNFGQRGGIGELYLGFMVQISTFGKL